MVKLIFFWVCIGLGFTLALATDEPTVTMTNDNHHDSDENSINNNKLNDNRLNVFESIEKESNQIDDKPISLIDDKSISLIPDIKQRIKRWRWRMRNKRQNYLKYPNFNRKLWHVMPPWFIPSSLSSSSSSPSSNRPIMSSFLSSSSLPIMNFDSFNKDFTNNTKVNNNNRNEIPMRSARRSQSHKFSSSNPSSSSSSSPSLSSSSSSDNLEKGSRGTRLSRNYDVPQIECPPADDGMERFSCPSPDRMGRYRCIDDHVLCDGFIDCPKAEDEDRMSCMFYKTTKAHLDVLADALLRWARGRY